MRFSRPLALLLLLVLLALPVAAALAQESAVVTLQPVAFVPLEGETFTTDVMVENTKDLLGFQFDVNFDPAAYAVEGIELGPFLSSTGRSAQPLGPDLRDAANGRVVYGGFTLGAQDQPGAEGSGVLATITWRVVGSGDFTASLSRVQLAGPGGQALPVQVVAAEQPPVAPAPAAETAEMDLTEYAGPVVLVALVLVGALYALWRISHKPGGNRAPKPSNETTNDNATDSGS